MKIRIIDLMDCYYDDTVKMPAPSAPGKAAPDAGKSRKQTPEGHGIFRPVLAVAASLLLVLTAGSALYLRLSGGPAPENTALAEDAERWETAQEPTESVPEQEIAVAAPEPEASEVPTEPETADTVQAPGDDTLNLIAPVVLDGTVAQMGCYGNLLCVDGAYYTMTESGPERIEMEHLHTTVELYGSWDVNMDYQIVDGAIVLHDNNLPVDPYTYIDGEKVYFSEYGAQDDLQAVKDVTWITPDVATVTPLEGSADTVMLTVRRADKSTVETCRYPFFYNVLTGEITDPLASVPDLFRYGNMSTVQFNSACTRAIVSVFGIASTADGEEYLDGQSAYVCDLSTGEMALISSLLEPFLPALDPEGGEMYASSGFLWADDDSLLFWEVEAAPKPDAAEDEWDPWERRPWLFSYNVATGALNYRVRDVDIYTGLESFNQRYLNDSMIWDEAQQAAYFRMVDTADGTQIVIPGITVTELSGADWDEAQTRAVFRGDDGDLFLLDNSRREWWNLRALAALPDAPVLSVHLVTDNWLCLQTDGQVYSYVFPEDLLPD